MVRKGISRGGAETRRIEYLWDDWNIIREIATVQSTTAPPHYQTTAQDNVWGLDLDGTMQGAGGVGGLLAVLRSDCVATNSSLVTRSSSLYLPTYDANGNVSEYVTTNGEVVAHYDYSPFGETLIESGDLADTFTHRFSTKPWCPVTGLYEYQMRKYRPEIGRWISRDSIGENGGINVYCALMNSCSNLHDALGKSSCFQKWTCNFVYSVFVYISNFFPPGGGPPPPDVTFPGEIDPPPIVEPGVPGITPPTNAPPVITYKLSATATECDISPEAARNTVLMSIGASILVIIDRLSSYMMPVLIVIPQQELCYPNGKCDKCAI